VIQRFQTGLSAEIAKRDLLVKRAQCVKEAQATQEYMNLMAASGPELEKISNSNLSDEKKMAEMQKVSAGIKERSDAFDVKKCGPVVERLDEVEYEAVGAQAGGFDRGQYALLKERIRPFCEGIAKGSSSATDQRLAYSDSEAAAIRPQCAALLSALRKTN